MKAKLIAWVLLGAGVLSAVVAFGPAYVQGFGQASAPGRLVATRVQGKVDMVVTATKVRTTLGNNASAMQGSVITTGPNSSVVLIFSNGAQVILASDSELNIEKFAQDPLKVSLDAENVTGEPNRSNTALRLVRGEMTGIVPRLKTDEGSSYTVETPAGVSKISGDIIGYTFGSERLGRPAFTVTRLDGRTESKLGPAP